MGKFSAVGCAVGIALTMGSTPSAAQWICQDTTINSGPVTIIVGFNGPIDEANKTNPCSPTVTVGPGAEWWEQSRAYNSSTVNASAAGPSANSSFLAHDQATLNLLGGQGWIWTAADNASINVTAGTLEALFAHNSAALLMTGGVVKSVTLHDSSHASVTGGQILFGIDTRGASLAEVEGITVGRMPDGTVSPNYGVHAFDQSTLAFNTATLAGDVTLYGQATGRLNSATVHGSVLMLDNFPVVLPKQTTVVMNGGTVDGNIGGYMVNITGGNIGGGVSVLGQGAIGTIGNATVVGTVGAGEQAVVAVSGGTIGGVTASVATLSTSNAAITGAASVSGVGAQVGSLTITAGTVGSVFAQGFSSTGPLNARAELSGPAVQQNVTASDGGWIKLLSGNVAADTVSSGAAARTPNPNNPDGSASLVEIQGGTVAGNASAQNRGGLLMVSGNVTGNLTATNNSRVNLAGGTVQGNLTVSDSARATQSGGSVVGGDATISGQRLTMTGGSITHKATFSGNSFLIMQNGNIGENLILGGQGGVISAATIGGSVFLIGSGQLDMSGGTVQGILETHDTTTAVVTGGSFKGGLAVDSSTIDVSGGTFNCCYPDALFSLGAQGASTLKLSGNVLVNGKLASFEESRIEMSGGTAQAVDVVGHSTLVLSGNSTLITGNVVAHSAGSIATITGGSVHGDLLGAASSTVYMFGGQVDGKAQATQDGPNASFTVDGGQIGNSLLAFQSSNLTMNGGAVLGSAEAYESSKLTINGGSVGGDVLAHNNATVLVSGSPSIGGFLKAADESTINVSGGTVLRASAIDHAKLNMSGIVSTTSDVTGNNESDLTLSGGSIGGDLILSESSVMDMSGGLVQGKCLTQGASYLAISGGSVMGAVESQNTDPQFGGIHLSGGVVNGNFITGGTGGVADSLEGSAVVNGNLIIRGKFNMEGGTVHTNAAAFNSGELFIGSGAVALHAEAHNNSTVNLAGGSVGVLEAFDNGKVDMSGGIVQGNFLGFGNSVITKTGGCVFGEIKGVEACTMNISGGPCGGGSGLRSMAAAQSSSFNVVALDSATLKFIGTDLSATLVDPAFEGTFSLYELSGTLADGTVISAGQFKVQNGTGAQYKLIHYVTADLDFDGDVDPDDLVKFRVCSTGPAIGPPNPGCEIVDFDDDNDVDMDDFGVFQRCYSGADRPAEPNCGA